MTPPTADRPDVADDRGRSGAAPSDAGLSGAEDWGEEAFARSWAARLDAAQRRVRGMFGSMTGQIFLILTIGTSLASILSLLAAEQVRRHDIQRFRQLRVVASATDIAERLRRDPTGTGRMLSDGQIMGAATAPDGIALTETDPSLEAALAERFGPRSAPEAGQVPTGLCFPYWTGDPRNRAAGLNKLPRPDCWVVRFTDESGQRNSIAIELPRIVVPRSTTLNPLFLFLILCASAGLAAVVARFVSTPLRRLEESAAAFSISRDPEPIPERGPEEVRAALSTFNLMQQRVRDGFRERTQLLSAISHDLQTPLTRLRLRLEQVDDPPLRRRLLDDHAAMQRLVREGLDLANSTESREEWSVVDIDSLIASMVEDAQELDMPVRFDAGVGGTVRTKPNALVRCLGNLIDNAVQYGGCAEIGCVREGGRVLVSVRDRGPGIAPALLEEMFEPFTRGPAGQPGGRPGTGIGLTIARSLALSFDGAVRLRNARDGGIVATVEVKAS